MKTTLLKNSAPDVSKSNGNKSHPGLPGESDTGAKRRLFESEHRNPAPGSMESKTPVTFDEETLRASELRETLI
jgi:hypothetical protein